SAFLLFISLSWYSARQVSPDDKGRLGWLRSPRNSILIRVLLVGLMVGTLIAGVLWMGGEGVSLTMASQRASVSTPGVPGGLTRQQIWRSTLNLIKKNPWTGVGFGAY